MMNRTYPDKLEIKPLDRRINVCVTVPASKSVTNRALLLSALCSQHGPCALVDVSQSADTQAMVDALSTLGYSIQTDWPNGRIQINKNFGALVPRNSADVHAAESGTTLRFVLALAAAGQGRFRMDGSPQLRARPIFELVTALRELGATIESIHRNDRLPLIVESSGLKGGRTRLRGDVSSQFI